MGFPRPEKGLLKGSTDAFSHRFDTPATRCYIPPATVKIIVCAKQVVDPETPVSAFKIDQQLRRVTPSPGIPPVVNGFDENATEAALRIKDSTDAHVTVLSVGHGFTDDGGVVAVMKKPLSMGADELVLVEDPALVDLDPFATAYVLAQAITQIGEVDLVLCGRQASDWDNAQVPLILAELLEAACVTVAQSVTVADGVAKVERVLPTGYEELEANLPAVVTVSNELGEPRYPTLRGIMAAGKKKPVYLTGADLGLDPEQLKPRLNLEDLFVPESDRHCDFIEGESPADSGRLLALKLREDGLI
jgi:electron transfer flavoprotein beta subunit